MSVASDSVLSAISNQSHTIPHVSSAIYRFSSPAALLCHVFASLVTTFI